MATERQRKAEAVMEATIAFAGTLGVEFVATWEMGRISFLIRRNDASPGAGAQVIRHLLALADANDIPVALDVLDSVPRLIEYYWQFGFRAFDDKEDHLVERECLEQFRKDRSAFLALPGRVPSDYGVTFMWRDRHAGPLKGEN